MLNLSSTSHLFEKILSNDYRERERAWKAIYMTNYPKIKSLITKNGGMYQDAVDVFHDGLLILHLNIKNGNFKGNSSVDTYLYSICKNLWLRKLKQNQSLTAIVEEASGFLYEEEKIVNTRLLGSLINQLGEECKDILVRFYYKKESISVLQKKFGLGSLQATKNKKYRCLKYLSDLFKEKGINQETMYHHEEE